MLLGIFQRTAFYNTNEFASFSFFSQRYPSHSHTEVLFSLRWPVNLQMQTEPKIITTKLNSSWFSGSWRFVSLNIPIIYHLWQTSFYILWPRGYAFGRHIPFLAASFLAVIRKPISSSALPPSSFLLLSGNALRENK